MLSKSPLAPKTFPLLAAIDGVKLAYASCGVKYKNRTDLMLAIFDKDTKVAGVFTKSMTASANIVWGRKILEKQKAKVLIVNSGNANAFNGKAGEDSIERIVKTCVDVFDCKDYEVYPCATGVIGEVLPDDLITDNIIGLKDNLNDDAWEECANAITTTDTFAKGATATATIGGVEVKISAIAKGSGMIAPDMATMLAYIFTDANIEADILQEIINDATQKSFNSVTVDSDTSTSDTLLCFATCKAKNKLIDNINSPELADFVKKINQVCLDLAHQIVKDGEGASKFIEINVTGAQNDESAKKVGLAIANSPLVKTAIAGSDANWGRIVMAIGKSGQKADRDKISINIGGYDIVKNGQLYDKYEESKVTKHMQGENIIISVDLGIANGGWKVWTCDLTHNYITINANYRS